jgi:hypothetical protein
MANPADAHGINLLNPFSYYGIAGTNVVEFFATEDIAGTHYVRHKTFDVATHNWINEESVGSGWGGQSIYTTVQAYSGYYIVYLKNMDQDKVYYYTGSPGSWSSAVELAAIPADEEVRYGMTCVPFASTGYAGVFYSADPYPTPPGFRFKLYWAAYPI